MHPLVFESIKEISHCFESIPVTNDLRSVRSKLDYFLSRVIEKCTTLAISGDRVQIAHALNAKSKSVAPFIETDGFASAFLNEADVTLASGLLRALLEVYLDVFIVLESEDPETMASHYVWTNFLGERRRIVRNAKSFYGIEPPSFKRFLEICKSDEETYRKSLISKSTHEKLAHVIRTADPIARTILGRDYYHLYSFLSKKTHFDLRNLDTGVPAKLYMDWSLAFLLAICKSLQAHFKLDSTVTQQLSEAFSGLKERVIHSGSLNLSLGDIVRTEFGIGEVTKISQELPAYEIVDIEYFIAPLLGAGFMDSIPALIAYRFDEQVLRETMQIAPDSRISKELLLQRVEDPELSQAIWYVPFRHPYQ